MLYYAAVFFVIALIAAVFGFTGIAAGAAEVAKILFLIFVVLFAVSLVIGLLRGRGPRVLAAVVTPAGAGRAMRPAPVSFPAPTSPGCCSVPPSRPRCAARCRSPCALRLPCPSP